jgi:ubiquinone/menaquinone biosynthesis C-methylase UbiE
MADAKLTSSGHALAQAAWLDDHFESARAEYEESVHHVGLKPGWSVLDAGCGGGNFLPLICELVGPQGLVTAMDLAPENVAHVEALIGSTYPATVQAKIGSVLDLPFGEAAFDCIWTANVTQYLTETEVRARHLGVQARP